MTKLADMPMLGQDLSLFSSPEPKVNNPGVLVCIIVDVGISKYVSLVVLG